MNRFFDAFKIGTANVVTWTSTVVSMQALHTAVSVVAGIGSIAVSVATIWWIRKQAAALNKRDQ